MGKSKRKHKRKPSNRLIDIIETDGTGNVLAEPRILSPDEEILEKAMEEKRNAPADPEKLKKHFERKRVELLENISPILRAGDVMIKYSGRYVKEGEHFRNVIVNERMKGLLGWLGYTEKVEHPNHFHASHVEELVQRGKIFKALN